MIVKFMSRIKRVAKMCEKCPNTEFFGPNMGKYGPEKTLHLDTFHVVSPSQMFYKINVKSKGVFLRIQNPAIRSKRSILDVLEGSE